MSKRKSLIEPMRNKFDEDDLVYLKDFCPPPVPNKRFFANAFGMVETWWERGGTYWYELDLYSGGIAWYKEEELALLPKNHKVISEGISYRIQSDACEDIRAMQASTAFIVGPDKRK